MGGSPNQSVGEGCMGMRLSSGLFIMRVRLSARVGVSVRVSVYILAETAAHLRNRLLGGGRCFLLSGFAWGLLINWGLTRKNRFFSEPSYP